MVLPVSTLVLMVLPVSTLVLMVLPVSTLMLSINIMHVGYAMLMSKNDCDPEGWIVSSMAPINFYDNNIIIITFTYLNCYRLVLVQG